MSHYFLANVLSSYNLMVNVYMCGLCLRLQKSLYIPKKPRKTFCSMWMDGYTPIIAIFWNHPCFIQL